MSNRYAVVVSSDYGHLPGLQAIINGSHIYGNTVDIHFVGLKCVSEDYTTNLPSNVFYHNVKTVSKEEQAIKVPRPRIVRFTRYQLAANICPDYESLLVLDADMFIAANYMQPFSISEKTGQLLMVRNPLGVHPSTRANIENIKTAVNPSYHCTGTFFNCKEHRCLLQNTYDNQYKEGASDMVALFRTILRSGYDVRKILPLQNELWIWTNWYNRKCIKTVMDGKWVLQWGEDGSIIKMVHGKWWREGVYEKVTTKCADKDRELVTHNATIFRDIIEWLRASGPVDWWFWK